MAPTDDFLYCTDLMGLPVYDTRQRKIGRVKDAAIVPILDPIRVDRFLVGGGWSWLSVRFDQVRSVSLDGIYLLDEQLTPYHSDEYMLRIVRDLLDQQIIDALGRKVVRVTDVTFEVCSKPAFQYLNVLEVDIGVRSVFRRLVQGVIPPKFVRRVQGPIPPHSIRWEFCNILEPDPQRRLRLNISNTALERMHPADLADIVEELSPEDREAIMETIDSEVAAEALSEMDPDVQTSILESLETEKAAEIIEEMSTDQAAHALADLEDERSEEILEEMAEETKEEVRELIEYGEDTAGFLMKTEWVGLAPDATVEDAMDRLSQEDDVPEALTTLFLVDANDGLVGSVPLSKLFFAPGSTRLQELAAERTLQVTVEERYSRIAELFDKYNLLTLPVVDSDGRLAGMITADDVIALLRRK